jgi:hypothetical protein
MVYYTIYVKNLHNNSGYIDIALENDQLLKDYMQFLDVGLRAHRTYPVVNTGGGKDTRGLFTVNLAEVTAITTITPG